MRLVVTTNWDERFLSELAGLPIEWICGRLPRDHIGGSLLPSNMVKRVNKKQVEKYIQKVHSYGFKFNYLMDGACLNNTEYSWTGHEKIRQTIFWVAESGADAVTVTLPHLVEIIKEQFPHLKVGFGAQRVIWEMTRVKYFDRLGVDWIILNSAINRTFRLLKNLKRAVSCELWLNANSGCLHICPLGFDHDNFLAHASNYTAPFQYTDYFNLCCDKMRLEKPQELIKTPWIRPEDLHLYEEIGYNTFILYPHTSNTDDLLKVIRAYSARKYKGNLLELLSAMGKKICSKEDGSFEKGAPVIENKDLDGFLENFPSVECAGMLCKECGYCIETAKKVVKFPNPQEKERLLQKYKTAIERIEDGVYDWREESYR